MKSPVNHKVQQEAREHLRKRYDAFAALSDEVKSIESYAKEALSPRYTFSRIAKEAMQEEMPSYNDMLTSDDLAIIKAYIDYSVAVEDGRIQGYEWDASARALLWDILH